MKSKREKQARETALEAISLTICEVKMMLSAAEAARIRIMLRQSETSPKHTSS